jgi:hypothetical protein
MEEEFRSFTQKFGRRGEEGVEAVEVIRVTRDRGNLEKNQEERSEF